MSDPANWFPKFRASIEAWARDVSSLAERAERFAASERLARTLARGASALDPAAEAAGFARTRRDLAKGLAEILSERLRVGLMGIFSVGKSSLINAIFRETGGHDVREIGKHPVDVDITILTHGPEAGKRRTLEEGDAVRIEETTYPFELLRRLTLVDTPGTDEIKIRDQAAIDYLRRVHVLLYLFLPEHVLAEGAEADFLSTLLERYSDLPRLYVVTHLSEFRLDPTRPLDDDNLDRPEMADWLARMNARLKERFPGRGDLPRLSPAPQGNTWFVDSHPKMTHGVRELVAYLLENYNETTANRVRRRVSLEGCSNSVRDLAEALKRITSRLKERLALVEAVGDEIGRGVEELARSLPGQIAGEMAERLAAWIPDPEGTAHRVETPVLQAIERVRARLIASPAPAPAVPDEEAILSAPAEIMSRVSRMRQEWIVERASAAGKGALVFGRSAVGRLLSTLATKVDAAVRLAVARVHSGPAARAAPAGEGLLPKPGDDAAGAGALVDIILADPESAPPIAPALLSLIQDQERADREKGSSPTDEFLAGVASWVEKIEASLRPDGAFAIILGEAASQHRKALDSARGEIAEGVVAAVEILESLESPLAAPGNEALGALGSAAARRLAERVEDRVLGRAQVRLEAEGFAEMVLGDGGADADPERILAGARAALQDAASEPRSRAAQRVTGWGAALAPGFTSVEEEISRMAPDREVSAAAGATVAAAREVMEKCRGRAEASRRESFDPSGMIGDVARALEEVRLALARLGEEGSSAGRGMRLSRFGTAAGGTGAVLLAAIAGVWALLGSWLAFGVLVPLALASAGGAVAAAWKDRARRRLAGASMRLRLSTLGRLLQAARERIAGEAAGPIADREVVLWGELSELLAEASRAVTGHVARLRKLARASAGRVHDSTELALGSAASRTSDLAREVARDLCGSIAARLVPLRELLAANLRAELASVARSRRAPLDEFREDLVELRKELGGLALDAKKKWEEIVALRDRTQRA